VVKGKKNRRMSQSRFLRAYADLLLAKDWSAKISPPDGEIRLKNNKYRGEFCFCPVTAVCFELTGKYFETGDFLEAGRHLKMYHLTVCNIVAAADGAGWCTTMGSTRLRITLLKLSR